MARLYRAISARDVYASAMGAELAAPSFTSEPPPRALARLEPCVALMGHDPARAKADHKRRHG